MKSIKDLISTRNESIVKLATKIGISRPTLYKALEDKEISFVSLRKICTYFGANYKDYLN